MGERAHAGQDKKLIEVARAWACGDLGDNGADDAAEKARAMGVDEAQIQRDIAAMRAAAPVIDLWPCNEPALRVFAAVSSQWRTAPLPGGGVWWQGIDYGVLPGVLRMMGIARREWADLFDDLRVMERAAASALNERKA